MFFQIRVSRVIFSIHFYHFFILRIIEFFPLFIVFNIIVNLLSLYHGNFTKKTGYKNPVSLERSSKMKVIMF